MPRPAPCKACCSLRSLRCSLRSHTTLRRRAPCTARLRAACSRPRRAPAQRPEPCSSCEWLGGVVWGRVVGVRVESRCSRSRPGPPSEQFPHFPHPFTIRAASGHDPLASEVLSTVFISAERSEIIYSLHTRALRQDHNSRDSVLLTHPCPFKTFLGGFCFSRIRFSPFPILSPRHHMAGVNEVPAFQTNLKA